MSGFLYTDHVGDQAGGAGQRGTAPGLAAAGGETVDRREIAQQASHVLCFTAHEDPLVRHEDLIKVNERLMIGVALAQVYALDVSAHLEKALVLRRPAENVGDARRVGGDGAGDGEIFILGRHAGSWDKYDLMGEEDAGLVGLIAADHDAVVADLVHMDVVVPVGLLVGRQRPKTFDVRYGYSATVVVLLHIFQETHEPLEIVGTQIMIHVVCSGTQARERLGTGTAVGTAADDFRQGPGRPGLAVGVFGRLERCVVDAYRLAGQVGLHRNEVRPLRVVLQLVHLGNGVKASGKGRESGGVLDLLPQEPNVHGLAGADTVLELFL